MSEEPSVEPTEQTTEQPVEQSVDTSNVAGEDGVGERFDFVLDKYRADGRSEAEAMQMQAQSYGELQSKFGSFTGSPDEYEVGFSDELTEAGLNIDEDDPMLEKAAQFAADSNMSQQGFSDMMNLYGEIQLAQHTADQEYVTEELKALGPNSQARIDGINKWADANLDAETVAGLQAAATSSGAIKAIEALIAKTRSAPVASENAQPAQSVTQQEVQEMQFAIDENSGQRKINIDPDFRKAYEEKLRALHGTGEDRQMFGS